MLVLLFQTTSTTGNFLLGLTRYLRFFSQFAKIFHILFSGISDLGHDKEAERTALKREKAKLRQEKSRSLRKK